MKREDTVFRRRRLHPDDVPATTDFEGNLEDDEEEETGSVRQYDVVVVEEEKEDAKARS